MNTVHNFSIPPEGMSRQGEIEESALDYARQGVYCFPVNGKDAYTPHGIYDATIDEEQIRQWWRDNPSANLETHSVSGSGTNRRFVPNVAYPMGEANGWIGVDIDPRHGGDEEAFWRFVGGRVETRIVESGGGGRHIFFTWQPGLKNRPEGKLDPSLPGIGARCQGLYLVAPPSIHPDTGQPYRLLHDAPPAEIPSALRDALTGFSARSMTSEARQSQKREALPTRPILTVVHGNRKDTWLSRALAKVDVGEGRNDTGLWLACQLRDSGLSQEEAKTIMEEFQEHVASMRDETYTIDEAHRTLNSTYEREPRDPAKVSQIETDSEENLTDVGNANRFAMRYGHRLKHISSWGWTAYSGGRWVKGAEKEAQECAKTCLREMLPHASREEIGHVYRSMSAHGIKNMLTLAASDPRMSASVDDFDTHAHLLNCENGTIDLRSNELRAHDANDKLSHLCPVQYDPNAAAPRFARFLQEVFPGDEELIGYLQRFFGYAATGETREERWLFASGSGSNGKGVLIRAIAHVLGDYAAPIAADVLTRSKYHDGGERTTPAYHALPGKRLIHAQEPGGDSLDEGKLKQLVSPDAMSVNPKHAPVYSFTPTHKLILAANKRLSISDASNATWRRTIPVDFNESFSGREDWALEPTLQDEAPGILAWLVEGARIWYAEGLGDLPTAVAETKKQYREESDPASTFFADVLIADADASVPLAQALCAYTQWQSINTSAEYVGTDVRKFAKLARNHGITVTPSTGKVNVLRGYRLPH